MLMNRPRGVYVNAENSAKLRLLSHKIYRSGRVSLAYGVQH
jgi:hypothetical protein